MSTPHDHPVLNLRGRTIEGVSVLPVSEHAALPLLVTIKFVDGSAMMMRASDPIWFREDGVVTRWPLKG